jgi:exopolyphosphatase/guanosine-5'-triphosphate,3'-diphosphate pyrophosphatase
MADRADSPPQDGRSRRRRHADEDRLLYGAIDLGTNNCRLLVARPTRHGFRVVDAYSSVVRLGEGLASSGALSETAMLRAAEAIRICSQKLERRGVRQVRCIATQACRTASNGAAFLERVKQETGLAFDLISPREEARLSVLGCVNLIDMEMDVSLIVDIGGGSTELSWVDVTELRRRMQDSRHAPPPIRAWGSAPVGVVTLAEEHPEFDPRDEWYAQMKAAAKAKLAAIDAPERYREAFDAGRGQVIGTSGTVTSIAGVHMRLPRYDRRHVDGAWLTAQEARAAVLHLLDKSVAERALEPSIGPERADLVLAGCAIFEAVMDDWPAPRVRVADRGLREGVLYGLMGRFQPRRRRKRRGRKTSGVIV